jgi:hypothetical protein
LEQANTALDRFRAGKLSGTAVLVMDANRHCTNGVSEADRTFIGRFCETPYTLPSAHFVERNLRGSSAPQTLACSHACTKS